MRQSSNSAGIPETEAESSTVSKRLVVSGLGYPNGREEVSPEPVGWQTKSGESSTIEKQVSRETSR